MRSRSSPLLPYANGDKYSAKPGKPRSRCSLFRVVLLGSLAVFLTWSVYTFATIATIKKQAALNSGRTAGDRARLARLAAEQQEAVQASQDTLLQGSQAAKGKAADAAAEPCGEGDCLATGHTADVAAQAADAVTSLQAAGKAGGLYALEAVGVDGAVEPLSKYSGKVVLVVNVASQCGYTDSNYKGLQQLYAKHRDAGFEILAFPCNQLQELDKLLKQAWERPETAAVTVQSLCRKSLMERWIRFLTSPYLQ
ncbi:hypothetical protein WJX72_002014 [[Myrmecia] bisecta]|uniref:Glutathione peroxidase n=1 Tax=[Myrmecia] bisecta TaxID=41462 RepID=A0AAW1QED8_9CHLO